MVTTLAPFAIFVGVAATIILAFFSLWSTVNERATARVRGLGDQLDRADIRMKPQDIVLTLASIGALIWILLVFYAASGSAASDLAHTGDLRRGLPRFYLLREAEGAPAARGVRLPARSGAAPDGRRNSGRVEHAPSIGVGRRRAPESGKLRVSARDRADDHRRQHARRDGRSCATDAEQRDADGRARFPRSITDRRRSGQNSRSARRDDQGPPPGPP